MGPWGQAEGLSEPSLLLERCLEKERNTVCSAHAARGARSEAAVLLLGTSHPSCSKTLLLATGWGGGMARSSGAACSLLTATVSLPSSQTQHRALTPDGAPCPAPRPPSPRPDHCQQKHP